MREREREENGFILYFCLEREKIFASFQKGNVFVKRALNAFCYLGLFSLERIAECA